MFCITKVSSIHVLIVRMIIQNDDELWDSVGLISIGFMSYQSPVSLACLSPIACARLAMYKLIISFLYVMY